MRGPSILSRPCVSLPTTARPVREDEMAKLERLRFWSAVDRIAEARQAEKRALLAVAQSTAQEIRDGLDDEAMPAFLRQQAE